MKKDSLLMVYDCFTFFNEIEILRARLMILNKHVDYFVLCESTLSHSGSSKPLYYLENRDKFKDFNKKIIHIIADNLPKFKNSWTYENYQRNCLVDGLRGCKNSDIILISDVDEIPRLEKLPASLKDGKVYSFLQDMHFYYVNAYKKNHIIWEGGTKAVTYKTLLDNLLDEKYVKYNEVSFPKSLNNGATLTKVRLFRSLVYIHNGGWHFTYMGGAERILKKIMHFSHQELVSSGKYNKEYIEACLANGFDVIDSNIQIFGCDPRNFPDYIIENFPQNFILKKYKSENNFFRISRRYWECVTIIFRNWVRKHMAFLV